MRDVIAAALKKATGVKNVNLEIPEHEDFGDFSTNLALVSGKNANDIAEKLRKDGDIKKVVAKIEVKGPGFINFFLNDETLLEELGQIHEEKENYGKGNEGEGKTVVIDYSSPNIAKRFGIGHLRSTIIGQALYNLYSFLGFKVVGDNHLGDWGTQFGTLLYQIHSKGLNPSELTIDTLENLYVEFNSEAEKDEKLREEARAWFKKLEDGDGKAREIWQKLVETSLREFESIYAALGVKIDYALGESFYEDKMPGVIEEVRKKGLSVKSQGAEIIEFKELPPAMLIKKDGATTYFTRDLATIKYRLEEWNPEIIIYEVGSEQILHFRQLFEAVRLLEYAKSREFVHVAHGLIRLESGKMSTRRGETVKLEDVLNEAIKKARAIIEKSETGRGLDAKEKESVATKVGIGAVKYFDLTHQPQTDIIFDWEKIFVLEGNSAPYIQYTVARISSVLDKSGKKEMVLKADSLSKEEALLLRSLALFSEEIFLAARNYSPNLLANYLFSLAQKYNNFYNKERILGSDKEGFRLALSWAVRQVLVSGLTILGIETPRRM